MFYACDIPTCILAVLSAIVVVSLNKTIGEFFSLVGHFTIVHYKQAPSSKYETSGITQNVLVSVSQLQWFKDLYKCDARIYESWESHIYLSGINRPLHARRNPSL